MSWRPAQQQKYGAETQVVNDNVLCSINNGRFVRQNWVTSNATKRNRDTLKPPLHGNALDDMRIEVLHLFEDSNISHVVFIRLASQDYIVLYFILFNIQKMKTNNTGQLPIEHCALFNTIAAMSAKQTSRCQLNICL